MLTHESIWSAIDRLAGMCGYSTSGLAKKAGLDPTSFNRSKRIGPDGKPRWPSTESLSRILEATGARLSDFLVLMEDQEAERFAQGRMIPVLGYAQAKQEGSFDEAGYPAGEGWNSVSFPHASPDYTVKIYGLEIDGNSMLPLFRAGDRLIISPDSPIKRGDRILVKTISGEIMAKELVRKNAERIEMKSLDPDRENRIFLPQDILWMARIIWVSQ